MLNIRSRLTYQFMALVTAILLLFSVGVYFFSKLYLEKRFFIRLKDRTTTTTTLLFDLQATNSTITKLVNISDKELLTQESVVIYDIDSMKQVFNSSSSQSISYQSLISKMKVDRKTTYTELGEYYILGTYYKKGKSNYLIFVSAIDTNGMVALQDLRKILMVMILAGILLLGLSGWFFADRALAPMSGIIKQVNGIFPDYIAKRVEHPNRSDEIGLLVNTFNQLLDRIEEALNIQKMFIANVSHELKNPLTKIFTQIDIALMQKRSPEVYEQSLLSLKEDTRTLIQLTNTLLNLANTIITSESVQKSPIRMDELLWETKEQLIKWHEDYQVQINFLDFPEDEESLILYGNEASLKVVLMNLMDNACKFSFTKSAVVDFIANQEGINISFFDEGPIIPEAEIPFIFHPFYRSNATAQATKGHGVGLAIVAQVTQLHKGQISVSSNQSGTRFVLNFPKA